jgi:two-component system OmpR family response regulator/two-component system response regulator QseB
VRLLVVEDDPRISDLLSDTLTDEGYAVDTVPDGLQALGLLECFPYDLVVLDVMLPYRDGFEVVRALRSDGRSVPVLMLTARDGVDDRVRGLESGADDYLIKPFHLRELRARVRALLRRANGASDNRVEVGALTLDLEGKRAFWEGAEVSLSGLEFTLLEFLALHRERFYSREALLEHVWSGEKSVDARTVDTYIHYLRRKLSAQAIETMRGLGYRFRGSGP